VLHTRFTQVIMEILYFCLQNFTNVTTPLWLGNEWTLYWSSEFAILNWANKEPSYKPPSNHIATFSDFPIFFFFYLICFRSLRALQKISAPFWIVSSSRRVLYVTFAFLLTDDLKSLTHLWGHSFLMSGWVSGRKSVCSRVWFEIMTHVFCILWTLFL